MELRQLSEQSDAPLDEHCPTASPPWLRVNIIGSFHGAETGPGGKGSGINNPADKRESNTLRRLSDCVVVGAGVSRDEG